MDIEREENLGITSYEDYLDLGGRFWQEDYETAITILGEKRKYVPNCIETRQVQSIVSGCATEVTQEEIQVYCKLRKKLHPEIQAQNIEDPRAVPVWSMCDQELIRQIFMVSEGVEKRSKAMAEKLPNIFR